MLENELGEEHLGIPIKFQNEPGVVNFVSPALGQHTSSILQS